MQGGLPYPTRAAARRTEDDTGGKDQSIHAGHRRQGRGHMKDVLAIEGGMKPAEIVRAQITKMRKRKPRSGERPASRTPQAAPTGRSEPSACAICARRRSGGSFALRNPRARRLDHLCIANRRDRRCAARRNNPSPPGDRPCEPPCQSHSTRAFCLKRESGNRAGRGARRLAPKPVTSFAPPSELIRFSFQRHE